jgi:hypothetical protein
MSTFSLIDLVKIKELNFFGESLVRAEEQAFRFNNFGSRKAFSIILFVQKRKLLVQFDAPISGISFLNFLLNSLHLKHCLKGC